jgi:hypothetical protein
MAFLGGRRWRTLTATLRRPVEGRLADGVELGVGQFDLRKAMCSLVFVSRFVPSPIRATSVSPILSMVVVFD